MFLLGSFGLWILPINLYAVILLVVAMFAFSIDVQTGVPRFWTGVGAVALIVAPSPCTATVSRCRGFR